MTPLSPTTGDTTGPAPLHHDRRVLWLGWLIAHAVPLVWINRYGTATGDVRYYRSGVLGTADGAMTEYPWIGTLPARLVGLLPGGEGAFVAGFVGLCLVTSALFTGWLLHRGRTGTGGTGATGDTAAWFWILFIAASGPVVMTRLDLFPALAVAAFAALQFAGSRTGRRCATVVLAVATMMKLWPGVLGAALVGGARDRSTRARVAWFLGSLVVLCAVVAVVAGPDALTSPLDYQGDRGLQIESVAATPVMVAAAFAPDAAARWSVSYAASKSFEIVGPGVGTVTVVATVATALTVLAALGWAVVRLVRDDRTPVQALAFSVTAVALVIATNKVFSPQYITWLAPLVAVALLVSRRRVVQVLALEVLVTAVLTTFVYPVYYDWLLAVPTSPVAVAVLALRNLGILVIAVTSGWWALSAARTAPSR